MKIGIEVAVNIFIMCFFCIIMVQAVGSSLYIMNTREYFNEISDRIEYSGCSEKVKKEVIKEAKNKGYSIKIDPIDTESGIKVFLLTMNYKIPVLSEKIFGGFNKKGTLQGYIC